MAAYRFYNPAPVFFDLLGVAHLEGGSLQFYDIGTTTPKSTWSDPDLTILNTNPVVIDGAGRANVNIFLDGSYTVVCKDLAAAVIWTRDVIPGAGGDVAIPPLDDGRFLTNDGVNLLWVDVLQVPDPTGQTGKVLTSTGTGATWQTLPDAPDPDIVITPGTAPALLFQAGISSDDTKLQILTGSGSIPASGTPSSNFPVTFDTPFSTAPVVVCMPTTHSNVAPVVLELTSAPSTTGFTVMADLAEGNPTQANIVNPVPFNWIAIGTKEVP